MSALTTLYLELVGEKSGLIEGESEDEEFRRQIELVDWSWSLTRSSNAGALGEVTSSIPPPPSTVQPSVFVISKPMCRASTGMLTSMRNGELLTATINMYDELDMGMELIVKLTKVRIIEYDVDADVDINEKWKLNYEKLRFEFKASSGVGAVISEISRPPGASLAEPESPREQIIALSSKTDPNEINNDLLKQMREAAIAGMPKKSKDGAAEKGKK